MTLLFGNLTQQFVSFAIILNKARSGDPDATAAIPAAAANFRRIAAKDATGLVYIGTSLAPFVNHRRFMSLGIATLVCTYIYMYVWVHTAEANAKRIRERYLRAVLRQDIQFFDKVGAGEVATRIQTDTRKSAVTGHFVLKKV